MLSKQDIQSFKQELEKERGLLEEALQKLGKRNPANPSDWVPAKTADEGDFGADRNDNADIIEDMHESNASLNELEGQLQTVLAALSKIEAGSYGVCEVSGEPIEVERLKANPSARTCKAHMGQKLP